ncbi:MAG: hypothetical protein HC846_05390, partial [Blastocatellia bacterium]|nr:hypothetical protein [Blastocatellia bacterium]
MQNRENLKINATEIREKYFTDDETWKTQVPNSIATQLEVFKQTEDFATLQKEHTYLKQYKEDTKFVGVPY